MSRRSAKTKHRKRDPGPTPTGRRRLAERLDAKRSEPADGTAGTIEVALPAGSATPDADGPAQRRPGPRAADVDIPSLDMTLVDRFIGEEDEEDADERDLEPPEDAEDEPPSGVALRSRLFPNP